MKRYLVFAGAAYYANGGGLDFVDDFDDLREAAERAESAMKAREKRDATGSWSHIFDLEGRDVIAVWGHCGPGGDAN